MTRQWSYCLTACAYAAVLYGIAIVAAWVPNAYMVGVDKARPGEAIFLDEVAVPLSQSLAWAALGVLAIGIGLWMSRVARGSRRRQPLTSVRADREG